MIKKSVFEDDLIAGMQRKLAESEVEEGMNDLPKAVDYINSAIDILEDNGMKANADRLLSVLLRIAQNHQPKPQKKIVDRHAPKSSDEMIKNLLHHGTVFNMFDTGKADEADDSDEAEVDDGNNDLLDADVPEDLDEVTNDVDSFEDEIDK
jgi:hypothetical protein